MCFMPRLTRTSFMCTVLHHRLVWQTSNTYIIHIAPGNNKKKYILVREQRQTCITKMTNGFLHMTSVLFRPKQPNMHHFYDLLLFFQRVFSYVLS